MNCKYRPVYVDRCKQEVNIGNEYCEKHLNEKCIVCKGQATHECSTSNQFLCGYPLCSNKKCVDQHNQYLHN